MKQATVAIIVFTLVLSTVGGAPRAATEHPSTIVFNFKQSQEHLGSGASLSPDSTKIVFVGADNALHIVDIASHQDRQVLRSVGPGLDVFDNPAFSPDGKRLVFSASGGTKYYQSNIYTVRLDGTGLLQLTRAEPAQGESKEGFSEYFYTPRYSPDGSQILAWRYDGILGTDSAVTMSSSGAGLRVLTSGQPLFWDNAGQAVFVARRQQQGTIYEYDLVSGATKPIQGLDERPLGRLLDTNTFVVPQNGQLDLMTVEQATARSTQMLPLASTIPSDESNMTLVQVSSDQSDTYLLLRYENESREVLQIVRIR